MEKEKSNYHPLFVIALLICTGLISPSNGLDDRTTKTSAEMIGIMIIALLMGVVAFSLWKLAERYDVFSMIRSQKETDSSN